MAITLVGGSFAQDVNGPTISTDLSSMDSGTIANGDVAILTVMVDQDDLTSIDQTAGDTFTSVHYDESTAGRDRGSELFYRVLDGTETTVTFTATGDTLEEQSIAVSVWRGVDNSTPFDVTWNTTNHYTEGQNNFNGTPDPITTATDGAVVVIMQTLTHDDVTTPGYPSGYTEAIAGYGSTIDNRMQFHCYKTVATAGTETPGAFTHTVNASVSEAQFRTIALKLGTSTPTVTDVETDEDFRDGDTALTITGTNYEATQGTGKVELSDNATYATGTKVAQTVTSWADTSIDFTAVLSTLAPGALYLWVTNDTGDRNAVGFAVTVHRKVAWELSLSSQFADGAATTNGSQMTGGTGTFTAGKINESTNAMTVDVVSDGFTELEWCMASTADAAEAQYEFRVLYADAALDTPGTTAKVTISGTPATSANAENASSTATGYDATVTAVSQVSAPAGNAAPTATAYDATVTAVDQVSAPAENAPATATGYDATVTTVPAVSAPAENAPATAAAYNATVTAVDNVTADAEEAPATAAAYNATITAVPFVTVAAEEAPATATAYNATISSVDHTDAPAEAAPTTATAYDATVTAVPFVSAPAEASASTATAYDATVSTASSTNAPAEVAPATAAAYDATVTAVPQVTAPAETATATATAYDATVTSIATANAENAPATATAYDATVSAVDQITAPAENAPVTATAYNATVTTSSSTNALAENTLAAATAYDATVAAVPFVSASAENAPATATAYDATVTAVAGVDADAEQAPATATAYDATVTASSSVSANAEVATVAASAHGISVPAVALVVQSPAPQVENLGTTTEVTASWSFDTTAGNILFAIFGTQEDAANVLTPSGWTKLGDAEESGRGSVTVFVKVAAGMDAAVTVALDAVAESSALAIGEVSGLNDAEIPAFTNVAVGEDASTSVSDTAATVSSFASINNGDAIFYGFYGRGSAWDPITLPSGIVEEDGDGGSNVFVGWGHDLDGGSTSSTDFDYSGTSGGRFGLFQWSWPLGTPALDVTPAAGTVTVTPGSVSITTDSQQITPDPVVITVASGALSAIEPLILHVTPSEVIVTQGGPAVTLTGPTVTVTAGTVDVVVPTVEFSAPAVSVTGGTVTVEGGSGEPVNVYVFVDQGGRSPTTLIGSHVRRGKARPLRRHYREYARGTTVFILTDNSVTTRSPQTQTPSPGWCTAGMMSPLT